MKAKKTYKQREQELPWHSGLSERVYRILNSAEITSRQEVKKLLGKGDYDAYLSSYFRRLRNFGWSAWQELCVWSGLPCPNRREFPYRRWSCMWRNHMGETGHCYGDLETLMRKALRHHAVHIYFAHDPQPQDFQNAGANGKDPVTERKNGARASHPRFRGRFNHKASA